MEAETVIDYSEHLNQVAYWPRLDRVTEAEEHKPIHEMNPGHAINAYHVLTAWGAEHGWNTSLKANIRYTALAQALLEQAVGEKVLYAQDQRENPDVDDVPDANAIAEYGDTLLTAAINAVLRLQSLPDDATIGKKAGHVVGSLSVDLPYTKERNA